MPTRKNTAIVLAFATITTMLLIGFTNPERITRRMVRSILRLSRESTKLFTPHGLNVKFE